MKKVTPVILLSLAVVLMYFAIQGSHGYFQLLRTHREGLALERKSASLDKEIRDLRRQIQAIDGDALALERQAREGLGFGKENETLYIFPSRRETTDMSGNAANVFDKNTFAARDAADSRGRSGKSPERASGKRSTAE